MNYSRLNDRAKMIEGKARLLARLTAKMMEIDAKYEAGEALTDREKQFAEWEADTLIRQAVSAIRANAPDVW